MADFAAADPNREAFLANDAFGPPAPAAPSIELPIVRRFPQPHTGPLGRPEPTLIAGKIKGAAELNL
jgi:hypothetical protein